MSSTSSPATVEKATSPASAFEHIVVVLLLIALSLGYVAYRRAKEDQAKLQATLDSERQVLAQQASEIKGDDAQMAATDAELQKSLTQLEQVRKEVPASPEATAAEIARYLHLPSPPAVETAPPAVPGGVQTSAPEEPRIVFTASEAEALRQAALNCSETGTRLTACQKDQADLTAKVAALEAEEEAVAKERDAAVAAAKGGTFFTRLKREAKDLAIGAAAGVAVGYALHR